MLLFIVIVAEKSELTCCGNSQKLGSIGVILSIL